MNTILSAQRVLVYVTLLFLFTFSVAGYASEIPTEPSLQSVDSSAVVKPAIPDGFVKRVVKKGETLSKICNSDSTARIIFLKVNRLDERHFPLGKEVLVPVDVNKAVLYSPVPATLADSRGVREIRIFLEAQYFGAYEEGKLLFWGPVSSGKKERATPPGNFFVNYKERFRRSLRYENAPMPFSVNYYKGYFIHQQSLPGRPASHGCVRLLLLDAERLFFWLQRSDPVTLVIR